MKDPDETVSPTGNSSISETIGVGNGQSRSGLQAGEIELEGYRDIEYAARGGMGIVYQATHAGLNRKVALKILSTVSMADPGNRERFRLEAEAVAHLEHPHIVPVYDVGNWESRPFIAMKWVEGGDMDKWMKQRRAAESDRPALLHEAVQMMSTVTQAIHHAHQRGFLHRDLKPSNIMVDEEGTAFVTDFGLARRLDGADELTLSGQVVGTPSFMSPEQARGDVTGMSVATDVFSLGAILYWILVGKPPFTGDSVLDVIRKINEEEPARPSMVANGADLDLETIALKCLRKEPGDRYASAWELADELERWLRGEPIHARSATGLEQVRSFCRRKPITAGLLGAVVILSVSFVVHLTLSSARLQTELARTSGRLLVEEQQRSLAEKNRQQAVVQREYARGQEQVAKQEHAAAVLAGEELQEHLLRIELREAQMNLAAGNTSRGMAELAALVRQHPDNVTFRRLLAEEIAIRRFATRNNWNLEHPAAVTEFRYSPDGSSLITGCADGKVRFFDTSSGEMTGATIAVGPAPVNHLKFSGHKAVFVASAGTNYVVADAATGAIVQRGVKRSRGRPLALSPDGEYLATTDSKGFSIRTVPESDKVRSFKSRPSRADIWATDSSYYVSSGTWGQLHVFPLAGGREISRQLPAKSGVTEFLTFPWTRNFLSVGHAPSAMLWNPDTGEVVTELQHPAIVVAAALSVDPPLLATGDVAGNVRFWNGTNHIAGAANPSCTGPVRKLVLSPSSDFVLAANWNNDRGEALAFETGSGRTLIEGIRWRGGIACDPRMHTVATQIATNAIGGWDLRANTGGVKFASVSNLSFVVNIKLSTDEKYLALSTANGIAAAADTATMSQSIGIANRYGSPPGLTMDPSNRHVVTYNSDRVILMNWNQGQRSLQRVKTGRAIHTVAYHKNRNVLILVSERGILELGFQGKPRSRHQHGVTVWGEYCPGPNRIYALTQKGFLGAIDADDYGNTSGAWKIGEHSTEWSHRSISPDGRWLAGISRENRLHLFELGIDGRPMDLGAQRPATSFVFGPQSKHVFLIDPAGDGRIVDLKSDSVAEDIPIFGRDFVAGTMLASEPVLVTVSGDKLLQFWDAETGLPVRATIMLPNRPLCVAAKSDGRTVFVGDSGGLRRISIPSVKIPETASKWLPDLAENLVAMRRDEDGRFRSISLQDAHANLRRLRSDFPESTNSTNSIWSSNFLR
jgi:serine/threonine protein kinase/WD40 repeat protein